MRHLVLVVFLLCTSSCASGPRNIQPQINSLVTANHVERALAVLGDDPNVYGPHDHLLFWLDKGMAAHLAGRTQVSIDAFEQAEKLNEALYTRSLSQMANTWIVNDRMEDYRGDEQEYVMINVFQAFNFASIGDFDEALVEARRLDKKLKLIGPRYQNPFALFLSGLLWHCSTGKDSLADALIDYQKAAAAYEASPRVLNELMEEAKNNVSLKQSGKARVIVVEYTGFSPVKVADAFPLPLDGNHWTKISFPRYQDRYSEIDSSRVRISWNGVAHVKETEVVCDLGALAKKILAGHKGAIMAKAAIRPLIKYGVEKAVEVPVRERAGDLAADLLGVAGSIYNLATEEADLRTWQSLPNHIRLAYVDLDPGVYDVTVEDLSDEKIVIDHKTIEKLELSSGQVKVIISRGRF